jgi:hypothetical protein
MTETFHIEEAHGRKAGDVIRAGEGAFMDCVVLGFNEAGDARLGRPYAYANGVGTTGPTTLTGVETFIVYARSFAASLDLYSTVESGGRRRT